MLQKLSWEDKQQVKEIIYLAQYFTGRFSDPITIKSRIGYLENEWTKCKFHSEVILWVTHKVQEILHVCLNLRDSEYLLSCWFKCYRSIPQQGKKENVHNKLHKTTSLFCTHLFIIIFQAMPYAVPENSHLHFLITGFGF